MRPQTIDHVLLLYDQTELMVVVGDRLVGTLLLI